MLEYSQFGILFGVTSIPNSISGTIPKREEAPATLETSTVKPLPSLS
jgi:hypothetical protein